MNHELTSTFLVLGLLFPRITLLFYYLASAIPPNPIPFWGDLLMSIFLPRVLLTIYVGFNLGTSSFWFWIYLAVTIISFLTRDKKAVKVTNKTNKPVSMSSAVRSAVVHQVTSPVRKAKRVITKLTPIDF